MNEERKEKPPFCKSIGYPLSMRKENACLEILYSMSNPETLFTKVSKTLKPFLKYQTTPKKFKHTTL